MTNKAHKIGLEGYRLNDLLKATNVVLNTNIPWVSFVVMKNPLHTLVVSRQDLNARGVKVFLTCTPIISSKDKQTVEDYELTIIQNNAKKTILLSKLNLKTYILITRKELNCDRTGLASVYKPDAIKEGLFRPVINGKPVSDNFTCELQRVLTNTEPNLHH